ncbi:MAG: hypothetical protein QNK05_23070 [Myxococcota bacterium]|nr:hypothetical protein [Myxococcota bacterium]
MQRLGESTGRFRWNRAGWFGGQIGATAWLVLLGALLWMKGVSAGAVVLALGLVPNVLGVLLWQGRRALNPYPAVQLLVAVSGVSAAAALLFLQSAELASGGASPDLRVLLVYPAIMAMLHVQERLARHAVRG